MDRVSSALYSAYDYVGERTPKVFALGATLGVSLLFGRVRAILFSDMATKAGLIRMAISSQFVWSLALLGLTAYAIYSVLQHLNQKRLEEEFKKAPKEELEAFAKRGVREAELQWAFHLIKTEKYEEAAPYLVRLSHCRVQEMSVTGRAVSYSKNKPQQEGQENTLSDAVYLLATMYKEGKGVPKNPKEADRLFQKAAKAGHGLAAFSYGEALEEKGLFLEAEKMFHLAAFHQLDEGLFRYALCRLERGDKAQAKINLIAASNQGHLEATYRLGCLFEEEGDLVKALQSFSLARSRGHLEASIEFGKISPNKEEALNAFLEAAQKDHPEALYVLGGNALSEGRRQDAFTYLERAAQKGYPEAALRCGEMLYQERKVNEARPFFQQAVDAGCVIAYFPFAYYFLEKEGKTTEAKHYYEKAASIGDGRAFSALGTLALKDGNSEKARDYFREAAERENPEGIKMYGEMALNGIGGEEDHVAARQAFKKIANGDIAARFFYAYMCLTGKGGDVDLKEAKECLRGAKDKEGCLLRGHIAYKEGSLEEAKRAYEQAADGGSKEACLALSAMYKTNEALVRYWRERAESIK